jgi:hypothetical protein
MPLIALRESKFFRKENAPELNSTEEGQLPPVSVQAGVELLTAFVAPGAEHVPMVEEHDVLP